VIRGPHRIEVLDGPIAFDGVVPAFKRTEPRELAQEITKSYGSKSTPGSADALSPLGAALNDSSSQIGRFPSHEHLL
jgi:hypothetical protein